MSSVRSSIFKKKQKTDFTITLSKYLLGVTNLLNIGNPKRRLIYIFSIWELP